MTPSTLRVAVIGGGWAGCAAAVELSQRGAQVTLYESARVLGGRARRVDVESLGLDNGQHILIGAYSETLRIMRLAGIDLDKALLNLPLQMRYPEGSGMDFVAPRWPAPLHMLIALLRAKGLSKDDKLALARFSTTARWMDWQLNNDCSVSELLVRFDQTERLTKLMWRPLCIAALNTPPERASAKVFLNVLRDSLGASRRASDMLLPRTDLSALFPRHAASYIEHRGGTVLTGKTVKHIVKDGAHWRLDTNNDTAGSRTFDAVVVATQAAHAAVLLDGLIDTSVLTSFEYEPITTCYLQYASTVRLPLPFLALVDEPATQDWGQFVFDRGTLNADHSGLLAVVVSASTDAIELGHESLTAAVARQLATVFSRPEFAQPIWTKVISEKRATFSCAPGLMRPPNATGIDGLVLAGDYTAGEYPATLEAAVRSGVAAARAIS
jgi:hydroxysqualene dehydroxylase